MSGAGSSAGSPAATAGALVAIILALGPVSGAHLNPLVTLAPNANGPVGGSQPHTNFQPYLCINFIISLFGVFPSQT